MMIINFLVTLPSRPMKVFRLSNLKGRSVQNDFDKHKKRGMKKENMCFKIFCCKQTTSVPFTFFEQQKKW